MKRWMTMIFGTVMAVVCMLSMTVSAFALETPKVSVPVSVSLSGTLPKPAESYTVVMKSDGDFPMPKGATGDEFTLTIPGEDKENTDALEISYDTVGVYTYTIYQVAGENKKCTYDDTVYALTVYVTNAEDGSGLEATAVLYPDSQGDKLPGAEFKNQYETEKPTTPDVPKTGDESNLLIYVLLMAVCAGVLVTLFVTRKSRKSEE